MYMLKVQSVILILKNHEDDYVWLGHFSIKTLWTNLVFDMILFLYRLNETGCHYKFMLILLNNEINNYLFLNECTLNIPIKMNI